jgi:hypothetical protein
LLAFVRRFPAGKIAPHERAAIHPPSPAFRILDR